MFVEIFGLRKQLAYVEIVFFLKSRLAQYGPPKLIAFASGNPYAAWLCYAQGATFENVDETTAQSKSEHFHHQNTN